MTKIKAMSKENYQITGYVPSAIYDRLIEFQKDRGFTSLSQALTVALEEYLLESFPTSDVEADPSRLDNLETQLIDHSEQLFQVNQQLLAISQRLEEIETRSQISTQSTKSVETTPGGNQTQNDIYESEEAAIVYPILAVHWPELLDALSVIQQRLIPSQSAIEENELNNQLESDRKTEVTPPKTLTKKKNQNKTQTSSQKSQPEFSSNQSQRSPLSQTALSERLNVPRSTLRRKKTQLPQSEFTEWTRTHDPEGIAWVYSAEINSYYPLQ